MALATVGCRLNQYETEKIADELTHLGLQRRDFRQAADVYILNTCTVTGKADADCRKLINRAYRNNPEAVLVVTGCYVAAEKEMLAEMNGVDLVVGNDRKMDLPQILQDAFPQLFISAGGADYHSPDASFQEGIPRAHPPHRPMVQIGTGCNQRCSYCIVPKVRGGLISFDASAIIDEIKGLADSGYHEVVLTAVHIGKYEYEGLTLGGLVDEILARTTISRVRLSSLEPNELDDRLLDVVAHHDRVCRHLHLPLQSGSDTILRAMRRPYTKDAYLQTIRRVKDANSDITVGCDLIVGFPGESNDDFADSLEVLQSGCLDYGHIFSYSDRPGTKSSEIIEKVSVSEIKERNLRARLVCDENRRRHMGRQIGKELGVISERSPGKDGLYRGVSDNYIKIKFPQFAGGSREIVNFLPDTVADGCLTGRIRS